MTPTLYLTRNGLLEPLGQSQVFAYLRGLSVNYAVTLISHEKDEDWNDSGRMSKMQAECAALGIRWLPQRFRTGRPGVASVLSLLRLVWLVVRETRRQNIRLLHARSYVPSAIALTAGWLTGVPFIFDMRALWPEELITAGRLRRGSVLHRLIVAGERACLRHAAAVVSLTHAAVAHLEETYPRDMAGQRVKVIPTCADLDRFVPAPHPPSGRVIGCLGTVLSGWFRVDWLSAFLAVAAKRDPSITFEITTRDDARQVRTALGGDAVLQARIAVAPCAPEQVQDVLWKQMASVMFFSDGLGKIGSSPTRMGEILGCGLPVVANGGVGDVARIIRDYRVGVLVASPDEEAMGAAFDALTDLLADPGLADRCRKAAEDVFSLRSGTRAYAALYREIITGEGSGAA